MYGKTEAQESVPFKAIANVTAGFRWAGLSVPDTKAATATAIPHPIVMTIHPELLLLVLGRTTPATTPFPRRIRIKVPKNSPNNSFIISLSPF